MRLLPGKLTHFALVQDPDTSQFLGAGEVDDRDVDTDAENRSPR